jgi:hypothetical protein
MQFEDKANFVRVVSSPIEGGIVPLIVNVDRSISTRTPCLQVIPVQNLVLLQGSKAVMPAGVHCHWYGLRAGGILGESNTWVAAISPQRALSRAVGTALAWIMHTKNTNSVQMEPPNIFTVPDEFVKKVQQTGISAPNYKIVLTNTMK